MGTEDVILGERAARREEPALSGAKGSRRSSCYHNGGILRLRLRMTAREHTATHSGQALIVAVLVLFAVATLAALFTAIISSQVAQTGRHADMVQLRNVAEAGLRWANEQLSYGIDGADWRPSQRVYRTGGGEVTIDISYGPIPSQLQSRFIRIVASAVFPDNPFLRHTILGLKPLLLTDYARFITDRYETNQPAALGVAGVEMGGAPREGLNGGNYVFHVSGPIRSNTDLTFYGTSEIYLFTHDYASWQDLGLLRDDTIEVSGELSSKDRDATGASLSRVSLWVDDTQRAIDLFSPQQAEASDYQNGYPAWRNGSPLPNTWRVLANLPDYQLPMTTGWLRPHYLAPPRIRPPLIDSVHPDLQTNRYLALTRDSGDWSLPTSAGFVNTGQHGWGWTNASGGIYIENSQDVQYKRSDGTHDLEKLRLNWVGSVGVHDGAGDNRARGGSPPVGPADWWDRTGRYYSPPGVEIILHGEAQCPWVEFIRDDAKPVFASVPMDLSNPTTYYYWEKPLGSVITNDTAYYPQGARCLPPLMTAPRPSAVGKRAVFPFPPNGVIYAEGNIRIRGMMPPARYEPYTYADFDRYSKMQGAPRRFDLQVVSGGTIYIEGDLLTPGPDGARLARMDRNGNATRLLTLDDDRRWGSRIALLARDYVCLNTTALFPRPVDMFQVKQQTVGSTTTNYWYNDLQPIYPKDKQFAYMHFQGPTDTTVNADLYAAIWPGDPMATDPVGTDLIYHNLRFGLLDADRRPEDLRLFIGHSGWYAPNGEGTPGEPPDDESGSDKAAVEFQLDVETGGNSQAYKWAFAAPTRYTFWRNSDAPDPTTRNESGHWYTEASNLEVLPDGNNPPYQAMSILQYLTGDDVLHLRSFVMPVRHYDDEDPPNVDGWQTYPKELGYVLGPVAIAPPRWVDGDVTNPKVPLEVQVQALIYAQNGSWFIIPGPWFSEDPNNVSTATPDPAQYPRYHEPLNIQLQFFGAISENMPAPIGDVADWTSKWSGTKQYGETYGSAALRYYYDPLLRTARFRRDPIDPRIMRGTPRFPRMPLTPDLVVWGERISGQAGG